MKTVLSALLCVAGMAVSASAGTLTATGPMSLYNRTYSTTTWNIHADAGTGAAAIFGAEGMTFYQGQLYISHDHNANRAAGNLVRYTPGATGDLSGATTHLMGSTALGVFGPEGVTVNGSGSGYGSFASGGPVNVVGIDSRSNSANPNGFFGVTTPGTAGSLNSIQSGSFAMDDVTYIASLHKFAVIGDVSNSSTSSCTFLDGDTLAPTALNFPLIADSKGLTTVSAAFATSLSGVMFTTAEAIMVVSEHEMLRIYDTNGNAVGDAIDFSQYFTDTLGTAHEVSNQTESIAVDEVNNLLYIGDEQGTQVLVVSVPTPGAIALLGMGGLFAGRRRR